MSCVYLQLNGQVFELPVSHTLETPECCNKILFTCLQSIRKALSSGFMLCNMSIPLYIHTKCDFSFEAECVMSQLLILPEVPQKICYNLYSLPPALDGSMLFLQVQLYTLPESLCKMDYSLYHLSSTLDDCVIFLQLQLRILPESVHKMCYNLYPLQSGLVALPRLRLTISDQSNMPIRQAELTELLDRSLPSHVFVMVSVPKWHQYFAACSHIRHNSVCIENNTFTRK